MYLSLKNRTKVKITDMQSEKLADLLLNSDAKYVAIAGCIFPVTEIAGIETDEVALESKMIMQGKWQCWKGNWHGKSDFCKCERSTDYGEKLPRGSMGGLEMTKEGVKVIDPGPKSVPQIEFKRF